MDNPTFKMSDYPKLQQLWSDYKAADDMTWRAAIQQEPDLRQQYERIAQGKLELYAQEYENVIRFIKSQSESS